MPIKTQYDDSSLPTDEDYRRAREEGHIMPWDEGETMVAIIAGKHHRDFYHPNWEINSEGEVVFSCSIAVKTKARLVPKESITMMRDVCSYCDS